MSLYKRKDSPFWWVKLTQCGRTLQRSTGTADKDKARELHCKWESELWEQQRLGVRPSRSWEESVLRYLDESSHKASLTTDRYHLRWLHPHLEGKSLQELSVDTFEAIIKAALAEGVKNSTVNRRLEIARAILRKAVNEWEWLDRVPRVRFLKEPTRRVRFLTKQEAQQVLSEVPEHMRPQVHFALLTGLRQGNTRKLRWSQIDLERRIAWVHPDEAKARKAIPVPLMAEAVEVLKSQLGIHPEFVFTYRGRPVAQVGTKAWRTALRRAGVEDFRWHDLRHTWASWLVQSGMPLPVLQELGGWATPEMVRRYAHFAADHLQGFVDGVGASMSLLPPKPSYELATSKEVH